ncbi:MAG: S8 family serine peptidase [Pseudomonadota bacterium]
MSRPVILLFVLLCTACSAPSFEPSPVPPSERQVSGTSMDVSLRIILRFVDLRDEASVRAHLAELGQSVGQDLVYLRPMSGQAHVIQPAHTLDAMSFERLLERLKAIPGVEYAEPDRRLRHQ